MSEISYESYNKMKEQRDAMSNQGPRVGYFSLKNHGDEALVRIMHDSTDSFDMLVVHQHQVNGKWRNINCLRAPSDPIANCPFCAAEKPLKSKIYIHLIEYTKDENGTVVGTPKLWERPASYVDTLKNLLDNYGPLSEHLFKIKRNGVAGDMQTSYNIMYAPPTMFPNEVYKKDSKAFENVKALGTAVLNRTAKQMQEMLSGVPADDGVEKTQVQVTQQQPQTVEQQPIHEEVKTPQENYVPPEPSMESSAPRPSYDQQATDAILRPRRYY